VNITGVKATILSVTLAANLGYVSFYQTIELATVIAFIASIRAVFSAVAFHDCVNA